MSSVASQLRKPVAQQQAQIDALGAVVQLALVDRQPRRLARTAWAARRRRTGCPGSSRRPRASAVEAALDVRSARGSWPAPSSRSRCESDRRSRARHRPRSTRSRPAFCASRTKFRFRSAIVPVRRVRRSTCEALVSRNARYAAALIDAAAVERRVRAAAGCVGDLEVLDVGAAACRAIDSSTCCHSSRGSISMTLQERLVDIGCRGDQRRLRAESCRCA